MDYGTLWERFVADGLLTPAERDAARARQQRRGGTPDTAVLEVRPLTGAERRQLVAVAAEVAGIGVAHPRAIEEADPALLDRLPAALRRHHALLPTRMLGHDVIEVVTALNPGYVLSEIARLIGCRIEARLALEVEVRAALAERMGLVLPPRFIPLVEVLRRADARERHAAAGASATRATPATLAMGFAEELARALDALDTPQPQRTLSTAPLPGATPLAEPNGPRGGSTRALRLDEVGASVSADPSRMKTPVRPVPAVVADGAFERRVPITDGPAPQRPANVGFGSRGPQTGAGGARAGFGEGSFGEPADASASDAFVSEPSFADSNAERSHGGTPLFAVRSPNRSAQNAASAHVPTARSREGSHRIEAPFGLPRSATRVGRPAERADGERLGAEGTGAELLTADRPAAPAANARRAPAAEVGSANEASFADLGLDDFPPAPGGFESTASEFSHTDFSVSEASLGDGGMLLDAVLLDTDRDRPTLQKTPIGGFRIVDPALLLRDNPGRGSGRDAEPSRSGGRDTRRDPSRDPSRDPGRDSGRDFARDLTAEPSRDSSAINRKVVLRLDAEPRNETGPMPLVRGPQSAPSSLENNLRQAVRDLADATRLDAAMVRLRAAGAQAIDTLVAGFPGPLHVDRVNVDPLQVPVRDHGPLLRLLLDLGPLAAEALLPLIDTTDLEVRHYAVFAFTVLDPGSALPRLGTRLFDPDPGVRRVALLAVHHWRTRPEFPTVVQFIGRVVRAGRTGQSKLAIAILARLKALGGAPALLDLLVEDRDGLGDPAHRALVEMTRQDFGYAAHHWRAWLDRNALRPRVELLIEALDHPSRAIRGGALAELRALTGDHLGYSVDGAHADRRAAIDQWWYWWQSEGQATLGHYR